MNASILQKYHLQGLKKVEKYFYYPTLKNKKKNFLNIFWLYFTTHELHSQKKVFFFNPSLQNLSHLHKT